MGRMRIAAGFFTVIVCLRVGETVAQGEDTVPAPRRPNVVFLLSDDQRPDTISALGNEHVQTPYLDSLVRRGTVFTRAV